jgi:pyridoxal 5'-phosphate synthase pdxS subunit
MPADLPVNQAVPTGGEKTDEASNFTVKSGLARMLKGGVIMDVVNAEQVSHVTPLSPKAGFPVIPGW